MKLLLVEIYRLCFEDKNHILLLLNFPKSTWLLKLLAKNNVFSYSSGLKATFSRKIHEKNPRK